MRSSRWLAAAQHAQVAAAANERIHEVQRALSAIYHALMVSIHDKYGLPFFTGYTPPANYVQSQPLVPPTDTSVLVMEMSITDYWTTDGSTAHKDAQWTTLQA